MTRLLRRVVPVLVLVALAATSAVAEEPPASVPVFGMALGIGVASFPEGTYQSIRLSPDLAFGKFGIGLDLQLNYRFTGGSAFEIRAADWVPTSFQSFLEIYLPKIAYIRWATKGEPLYVKFGSIDDGTLGNGFVMGDYANTLFLPEDRHFGLSFDLDGQLFGFPLVGFESFIGNLAVLDVFGGRLYVRPLIVTKIPILSMLEVGGSFAMDRNPYLYDHPGDPSPGTVLVVDGDLRLPILSSPVFSLAVFGDVATITNNRSVGGMVGVGGKLVSFLTWGAQLRILGDGFLPVYFDQTYDLFRGTKWDLINDPTALPGMVGWYASLGTSFLEDKIVFNVGLDGPFCFGPDTGNIAEWPHLLAVFTIAEGILPGLSFDASYDKKLITTFRSLVDPTDAAIQARLNYQTGPAVISFVYRLRYDPTAVPDPWVVTSGLETSIELF